MRGTIYSSGFVIKPIEASEDGLPQCRVWYTGTVDTAGWIPVAVANVVNSNQPQNLASLRKLVISVAEMLMDVIKNLFALEDFKADKIEEILSAALEKHGHMEHPDILYDALKNYFLEQVFFFFLFLFIYLFILLLFFFFIPSISNPFLTSLPPPPPPPLPPPSPSVSAPLTKTF